MPLLLWAAIEPSRAACAFAVATATIRGAATLLNPPRNFWAYARRQRILRARPPPPPQEHCKARASDSGLGESIGQRPKKVDPNTGPERPFRTLQTAGAASAIACKVLQ